MLSRIRLGLGNRILGLGWAPLDTVWGSFGPVCCPYLGPVVVQCPHTTDAERQTQRERHRQRDSD